ncbi:MAG: hypothetical protein WC327_07310 [Candidatus Cloacimonadia bacterium]
MDSVASKGLHLARIGNKAIKEKEKEVARRWRRFHRLHGRKARREFKVV